VTPDEALLAYMMVGSLATNFYGIPRSTRDADFVVELDPDSLGRLAGQLPPGLTLQRQGRFDTVTDTTCYVIHLERSPFICELVVRSDDPHDRERFRRRQRVQVFGRTAFIASVEDMIVTKLRWATEAKRAKDRDDIRNVLAVQGPNLDWEYVTRWSATHGTTALLEEIRNFLPPL
jgi:hypothetical protein